MYRVENGRKMEEEEERMAEHIDKRWTDAGVIDTCPQEGRRRPKVTP